MHLSVKSPYLIRKSGYALYSSKARFQVNDHKLPNHSNRDAGDTRDKSKKNKDLILNYPLHPLYPCEYSFGSITKQRMTVLAF
jgi:hypothetical protein